MPFIEAWLKCNLLRPPLLKHSHPLAWYHMNVDVNNFSKFWFTLSLNMTITIVENCLVEGWRLLLEQNNIHVDVYLQWKVMVSLKKGWRLRCGQRNRFSNGSCNGLHFRRAAMNICFDSCTCFVIIIILNIRLLFMA